MYRLRATSAAVREAVPAAGVDAAALITVFGGATVLLFVLSLAYWVGDRHRVLTLVSYAFVALGTVLVLKTLVGAPRPPAGMPYEGDPYGFPSGHATAAVVVYGGAAVVYDRLSPRVLAVVGTLVAAIALSRVVIGVHYLGDILAGLALGTVILASLWHTVGLDPLRVFVVAAVVGTIAVAVGAPESALALGGSLGGISGAALIDRVPDSSSRVETGLLAVSGVVTIVLGKEAVDAVDGMAAIAAGNAVLVAAIVLLPVVVGGVLSRARHPEIHYS